MFNYRLISHAPFTGFDGLVSLLLTTMILKLKCESLNTYASKTCSHFSLQYVRVSFGLVANPSKFQRNQMLTCYGNKIIHLKITVLVEAVKVCYSESCIM